MTRIFIFISLFVAIPGINHAQNSFNNYSLAIKPVPFTGLPALHSYALAQHNGKWLIIGGRKDGIHARQPFNAFPEANNNTDIIVVDINTQQFWTSSLNPLPTSMKEQLQSTDMNFYQDADTLFVAGGYAYSSSAGDHITFPYLTSVDVPSLIDDVVNGNPIISNFKQISDTIFAITGGRLGKIGNSFMLVGGHRFDGAYNPMGMPTYTQSYSNSIRKFTLNNSGSSLNFSNYNSITDPIHLRRRDYNLLPQIFPNGQQGYTISSGVFQLGADLPFLYPVDITDTGYNAVTSFNQYLSNYHCAYTSLFDSTANEMHALFFGGMSQYYYQGGTLVQDNNVPFVKTISRLSRDASGVFHEFPLPIEMPSLEGAGSEFIPNEDIPHYKDEIIKLNQLIDDSTLIGHIYGGISSPSLNPFSVNQTSQTSASANIFAVYLIKKSGVGIQEINGQNPHEINVFPNPVDDVIHFSFNLKKQTNIRYYLTNMLGQIVTEGTISDATTGLNKYRIDISNLESSQTLLFTCVFDDTFYVTKKIHNK